MSRPDSSSYMQAHNALADSDKSQCNVVYSGTTACFVLVQHGRLYIGNVGDSRAMLGRLTSSGRIQGVQLSHDAKPEDHSVRDLHLPLLRRGKGQMAVFYCVWLAKVLVLVQTFRPAGLQSSHDFSVVHSAREELF